MAGEKILVIDDEAMARKVIEHHLVREGFEVLTTEDVNNVLGLFHAFNPDLIILDILMPVLDGIEVCRKIRTASDIPIIFLTSKGDTADIVLGLGIGGDDYVVKPFNPKELIARVKANLRRSGLKKTTSEVHKQKQVFSYPGLKIDLLSHTVLVRGAPVSLTNKEYELLALLAQNPNRVYTYQHLLELVWGYKCDTDYRTVMVHVNRLRKKIEPVPSRPQFILTVKGAGYKFSPLSN